MRVVVHTRAATGAEWTTRDVTLAHLPRQGDHILMSMEDREAEWHGVTAVTHAAGDEAKPAELYCIPMSDADRQQFLLRLGDSSPLPSLRNGGGIDEEQEPTALLLTLKQAATYAQTSVKTLRRLVDAGRLHALDYGTKGERHDYRFTREALCCVRPTRTVPPTPRERRRRVSTPAAVHSILPRVDVPAR